jgi:hypothetical protein
VDSNHRRHSQQIYSLLPLATREIPHILLRKVELVKGIEPPTCALQVRCSTFEPHQLVYLKRCYNNKRLDICQYKNGPIIRELTISHRQSMLIFMKHTLTMPENSAAVAAFVMGGDTMEPYIAAGQIVPVEFALPAVGECGLFYWEGRTLVRQYCEDSFSNIYLLCLNRARSEFDVTVPAGSGREVICLGRLLLDKNPPLPLSEF